MYRWTDYDSESSLVCPSNYLFIHPTPLFLSPLHIQLSIYPPLFSLLCTSNYLSTHQVSFYPPLFSYLKFDILTPTPTPFLCSAHLNVCLSTTFLLIYSLNHYSTPRFLSPLPIQLSFSLSTPFLSYLQMDIPLSTLFSLLFPSNY